MTKIKAEFLRGFNEKERTKANRAIKLLEEVINSDEFEKKVLNVRKFKRNFIKRKTGLKRYSNREILDLLRSGEDLNNPADETINLKLNLYSEEKNEIGHTSMSSFEISTYSGYLNDKSEEKYASHIIHEYMHVVGFLHGKYKLFGKRKKTVPYKIGSIVSNILTK